MIMLKCNTHLHVFFRAISTETVLVITFWRFCTTLFFDNKHTSWS